MAQTSNARLTGEVVTRRYCGSAGSSSRTGLLFTKLELLETGLHDLIEAVPEPRQVRIKGDEVVGAHLEDLYCSDSPYRRAPRGVSQQGHFPEGLARAQTPNHLLGAVRALREDLDGSGLDHIDVPALIPFLEDHLVWIELLQDHSTLGKDRDDHEENDADEDQPLRCCETQQQEWSQSQHAEESEQRDTRDGDLRERDQL